MNWEVIDFLPWEEIFGGLLIVVLFLQYWFFTRERKDDHYESKRNKP